MAEDHATWVYAVTSGPGADPLDGLDVAGIGGAPVRALDGGGLTAVISSVPADAVGEEALERSLSDTRELEAMVRAHHRVVEVIAASRPTLPLRLATVYHDDERVRGMLAERQAEFSETLRWLTGRAECGVKVWADPGVLAAAGPEPGGADREQPGLEPRSAGRNPETPGDGGAGTAYLLRRRASLTARADGWQQGGARAEQIHAALSGLAVAAHRHAPQDQRLRRRRRLDGAQRRLPGRRRPPR